jgi:lipopolysaccharide transport system ATP-binding protein
MIRVEELGKCFQIYVRPADRLWDWVVPARLHRGRPFWALRDVTFRIPKGSSMGVVGVNGAGKSTLLKILSGTTLPTLGRFHVDGRVSSLLELGTGFHPEFTGRQNLLFNGRMAGLNDEELAARLPAILDFAELGDFIDQPVRTYSSGMVLRLGFALASSVDPDVLIIDEALSVGDLHFQQKCLRRIREFHQRGVTVLFVSHDPSMVKNFCTDAILLDEGRIIDRGKPDSVLDYYTALLAEKYREGGGRARIIRPIADWDFRIADSIPNPQSPIVDRQSSIPNPQSAGLPPELVFNRPPLRPTGHRTGNFRALITSVYVHGLGAHGNAGILPTGSRATIGVRWVALEAIPAATVGIIVKDRLGQEIYGVNTFHRERPIGPLAAGEAVETEFAMAINLGAGLYSITAAVHTGENHTELCYDWVEHAASFQVLPDPMQRFTGLCRLDPELSIISGRATDEEQAFARQTLETLQANVGPLRIVD